MNVSLKKQTQGNITDSMSRLGFDPLQMKRNYILTRSAVTSCKNTNEGLLSMP